MIFKEYQVELYGDTSSATGTAVYDCRVEDYYDSDIGGSDGPEVTFCELLRFEMDGVHLTREQVSTLIGLRGVEAMEEAAAESLQVECLEAA